MDSEGFFGPGVDESYDAKVFTVATLLGAHVVYNTVKVIDQQAVGSLEMLVQRAQLFRTRSAATAGEAPEFLRAEGFPPLTWVVEDFVQELPARLREEGATGWLRTYLESSTTPGSEGEGKAAGRKSDFLTKVYRDIRVHTLFLPATTREQLRDLSRLSFNELTTEFRTEVDDLRRHILRTLQARTSGGQAMNGPALAQALQFLVRGLQQGMFHELPSIWNTWASQVAEVSLNDASAWFSSLTQRLDAGKDPVPLAVFNERLEQARETAVQFYRSLVRDFEVNPQVGELRRRMDLQLSEQLLPTYHDRVRRWIAETIAATKDGYEAFLAARSLPSDPAVLERESAEAAHFARNNFSARLATFASFTGVVTASSGRGPVVQMPDFSPDPVAQLASDLRARMGARSLENERAVQSLFKQALTAADAAVARELKALGDMGDLLGRERLVALRRLVETRCWQAFEDQLAGAPWSKRVAHYKAHRALVRTEHLDAKMNAFTAANEQRLRAHFAAGLGRAMAAYNANRSAITMPTAEADLEAEHRLLVGWTTDLLLGFASSAMTDSMGSSKQDGSLGLTDTEAFAEVKKRTDQALREDLLQLREKNVELWKAHSDEATRCAVAANRARERTCGQVFCLFTMVPWVHRSASKQHLNQCFGKSASGSKMTPSLQAQVFEAWYSKDMGNEAHKVGTRWMALLLTVAALSVAIWWNFFRQSPPRPLSSPYGHMPQSYFHAGMAPAQHGISQVPRPSDLYNQQCMQGGLPSRFSMFRGGA